MAIPTLVVSNPPHGGEVDVETAAALLGLDMFAARLKAVFTAPEIMFASDAARAEEFAFALGATGLSVSVVPGGALSEIPWPEPVSSLTFDVSHLRVTVLNEGIDVSYDAEVVGVHHKPPVDRSLDEAVELERAVASGHGPTIAQAIQRKEVVDLYFLDSGTVRRITIVPELLGVEADHLLKELGRRCKHLALDERLVGIRPRAPYAPNARGHGPERRRFSFGTLLLRQVLESISPELRAIPQLELGSRLAYALRPLTAGADR